MAKLVIMVNKQAETLNLKRQSKLIGMDIIFVMVNPMISYGMNKPITIPY
ncbi:hypothetical protein [Bartonella massiliensis]|nr:hypothetical protein [Bartonella massiliensis]